MDKKLARKNFRTALIATIVIVFMFAMTYVAAALYNGI
jgi:cytochrome c oxidase assembly protein Cox11